MELNDLLIKHVVGAYGELGKQWLKQLPDLITTCTAQWQLKEIKPIEFPSYNYVAFCKQQSAIAAVLKISPNPDHIASEIKTHQYFSGKHTVKLLAMDIKLGAVLLEQAVPGNTLKEADRELAIQLYANTVNTMHADPRPITEKFDTIYDWFETLDRIESKLIDPKYIVKAKQLIEKYYHNKPQLIVCHGDLHLENVILHDEDYINIDPKGVMGDLEFEVSAFDLLTEQELLQDDAKQILLHRIKALSDLTNCDLQKLQDWFFLRSVISAQWLIEDQGDPIARLKYLNLLEND